MYACRSILCLFFFLTTTYSATSQTAISQVPTSQMPTAFQAQAQTAVSAGKSFSVVSLTATAEWTSGSLRENGTAQLLANADGSTNVQLSLGKASRTEVQTKVDFSRSCTWIDGARKNHKITGPNCFLSIPWFAPGLFMQSSAHLSPLLATTDDGEVQKNGSTLHQMSYLLNLESPDSTIAKQIVGQSTVRVFFDPQTFLPVSLEYSAHPDNDDSQNIPVRVVFSNFQSVSGVMIPFHIEKYLQRALQLKLDVTNASIQ